MSLMGFLGSSFQGLGVVLVGHPCEEVSYSDLVEKIIKVFLLETNNLVSPSLVLNGFVWSFVFEHLLGVVLEDLIVEPVVIGGFKVGVWVLFAEVLTNGVGDTRVVEVYVEIYIADAYLVFVNLIQWSGPKAGFITYIYQVCSKLTAKEYLYTFKYEHQLFVVSPECITENRVTSVGYCSERKNTQSIDGILDRTTMLVVLDVRGLSPDSLEFCSGNYDCWLRFMFKSIFTLLDLTKAYKVSGLTIVLWRVSSEYSLIVYVVDTRVGEFKPSTLGTAVFETSCQCKLNDPNCSLVMGTSRIVSAKRIWMLMRLVSLLWSGTAKEIMAVPLMVYRDSLRMFLRVKLMLQKTFGFFLDVAFGKDNRKMVTCSNMGLLVIGRVGRIGEECIREALDVCILGMGFDLFPGLVECFLQAFDRNIGSAVLVEEEVQLECYKLYFYKAVLVKLMSDIQCRLVCIWSFRKYACLKQFNDGFLFNPGEEVWNRFGCKLTCRDKFGW